MPLLNYTTTIDPAKTVAEIQNILAKHKAKTILTNYDGNGDVVSISFSIQTPAGEVGFRLPANVDAVFQVLSRGKNIPAYRLKEYKERAYPQARRVAWRIIKDWVESQLAIVETEMVKLEQVFLPYAVTRSGQTLFELLAEKGFKALTAGQDAEA